MQPDTEGRGIPSPLILIVDDSGPLRSALRALISGAIVPCICVEAATGERAVAVAEATRPAVVVMDLKMPGMSGIEATRKIKAMLPHTQVVIVSMFEAAKFQTEAIGAGATAYLPKRVLHRELIPLLTSLLEVNGGECPMPVAERQACGDDA